MLILYFTLILIAYWIYKYHTQWKYIECLPGPIAFPIIGNALQIGLNPADYFATLFKWWHRYDKNIYRAWLAFQPYVIITDPKDVEVVLSSTTLLQKTDVYKFLQPWLGNGLLTGHGSRWHKFRKLITPSFHFKILIDFLEVMNKNSNNLIEELKEKSKANQIIDIQNIYHYSTLDVICETAMGSEINVLKNNNSELVMAMQDMCFVVQQRMFGVFKRIDFFFKLTSLHRTHKKALNIIKTFIMNVIEKRRMLIENNAFKNEHDDQQIFEKPKQIFLDSLLTATVDGRPLTNSEIFEEVSTFMFEGHDTTSSGITFCTYLLSLHPEIQENIYNEQIAVLGSDFCNIYPTYQNMQDMKYLEMVLKETERLYPSVPVIGRSNTTAFNLNGRHIPKNTNIIVFIMAMGYNEKYFNDPLKFDPERFNNYERNITNPYEYVPFSAGPRNCIGQKFAMLEMKSIISNIIRNFVILPPIDNDSKNNDNKYNPILATVLTLKSDNGVNIRLKRRNHVHTVNTDNIKA